MLSLWHLFSLPYWRRVWIVQEAALTNFDSPVMWGPYCVSTRQLQSAAQYIDTNAALARGITYAIGSHVPKQWGGLNEAFTGDRSLENRSTAPGRLWKLTSQVLRSAGESQSTDDLSSILDVLRLIQLANCTDPRDKVFAILSTAALRLRVQMRSDYTCKLGEVFRLFSTQLFQHGDLNTLRLVQAPVAPLHITWQLQIKPWTISERLRLDYHSPWLPKSNFSKNWVMFKDSLKGRRPRKIAVPACIHELPSWTICLECPTAPVLSLPDRFRAGVLLFDAVKNSTSISNGILTTNGVFIDTLTTLSAFNAREDSKVYPVNSGTESSNAATNLESVQEALCRTLLADTMPDTSPVPQDLCLRHILLDRRLWTATTLISRHYREGYDLEAFYYRNKELRISGFPLKELLDRHSSAAGFLDSEASDIITRATNVLAWRRLVCTKVGRIGLVPAHAQRNDRVAILQGCEVPLIFREQGDMWRLIGECYLHGIMRDEAHSRDDWRGRIESIRIC